MGRRHFKPEEIIAHLREIEVQLSKGEALASRSNGDCIVRQRFDLNERDIALPAYPHVATLMVSTPTCRRSSYPDRRGLDR